MNPELSNAILRRPARPPFLTPAILRSALGGLVAVVLGIALVIKGDLQLVMALCIAFTYGWIGFFWVSKRFHDPEDRRFVKRWFLIAYVIKVFSAIGIFYFLRDRISYDVANFEFYGYRWAEFWRGNSHIRPVEIFTSLHNYSLMVAVQYYLTDNCLLAPCIMNAFLGTLTVPILYQTARENFDAQSARYSAIFAAFVASWITWSSIAMRDIVMIFFLSLAMRELLAMTRGVTLSRLVRMGMWLAGVYAMRPYIGLVIILVTLSALTFRLTRHPVLRVGLAFGFIGVLALVFFHGGTQILLTDVLQSQTEQVNGARAAMVMTSYNNDDKSWGLHENFHGIGDVAKFLPIAIFYLLAGPFIWQYSGLHIVLLIPELVTWYALLFFGVRGCWRMRRRGAQIPMLSYFIIGTILYALISDAYAFAIRHRSQLDVPLILWASVGLPKRPPKFLETKDPAT